MKKNLMGLVLALVFAASLCTPAFAEGKNYNAANVTFDGTALTMKTDETNAFENILPGDTRTETITLTNSGSDTVIYYMDAAVLRALEQSDNATVAQSKVTAYTYLMSVQAGGTTTDLYNTTTGGQNTSGMNVLNEDVNGTVYTTNGAASGTDTENWIAVAQLDAGESATIQFSMQLDGAATQNDYNNLAGQLAFQFRVRDLTKDTEYKTTTRKEYSVRNIVRTVKTGDYTPIVVLVTILVLGFGLMYLLFRKKDDHNNEAQAKAK